MAANESNPKRWISLGVLAGAATFKAVALASLLRKSGYSVRCYLSAAAQAFVGPLSFEAVTFGPVITSELSMEEGGPSHLAVADSLAYIVCPATADGIAKIAHGMGSDPVSLAALPAPDLRLFAPAMNDKMWKNELVQRNVRILEEAGWTRVGPVTGTLAEGYDGDGRMSEPEEILEVLKQALGD